MTPHINAKPEDISKIVLAPGDPLRAKYIADNFLENSKLINTTRNILAYTGLYKEKEVTVFSTGMGMPSMGIYCYELYKFYNVETIIRIGSCGAFSDELDLLDIVLVENSYTEGNFALTLNNEDCHFINSTKQINNLIIETSKNLNIKCIPCNCLCSECFELYVKDLNALLNRLPKEHNIKASEMEAFSLFYTAKYLNKKAACLLSVVDSHTKNKNLSSNDREKSLNSMIKLALETCLNL